MSSESEIERPSQSLPESLLASPGYELTIEEQPNQNFRFRYKVDQLHTHGVLHGDSSVCNNSFPTVKLIIPTPSQEGDEYVVTVSLYHDYKNEKVLSPHLLKEKANKKVESFAPICRSMELLKGNEFRLVFNDCYIECTKKGVDTHNSLRQQVNELQKKWPDVPRKWESIKGNNPKYVYLGFNAFKKDADNNFTHVCGPVYSHKVAHQSRKFGILKLCNKYINNKSREITIVLTGPPPNKNVKVEIYEIDQITIAKRWHVEVKPNFVNNEVICFEAPKYDWQLPTNEEIKEVKCHIGILDSSCSFYYELTPQVERKEMPNKQPRIDPNVIQPHIDTSTPDSRIFSHPSNPFGPPLFRTDSINGHGNLQLDFERQPPRDYGLTNNNVLLAANPFGLPYSFGINVHGNLPSDFRQHLSLNDYGNARKRKLMLSGEQYIKEFERILNDPNLNDKSLHHIIVRLNNEYSTENENGNTIFHALIECNSEKFFKLHGKLLLLEPLHSLLCGAVNDNGENLLHYACALNKSGYILPLLNFNLKLSLKDGSGNTALHTAIEKQHDSCIEEFIEILRRSGKYPHMIDDLKQLLCKHDARGYTVMHLAVSNNRKDLLEAMLKFCQEYKINTCRIQTLGYGDTIAHLAAYKGLSGLLELMTRYVPDVCFCGNYAGTTAADIMEFGDKDEEKQS